MCIMQFSGFRVQGSWFRTFTPTWLRDSFPLPLAHLPVLRLPLGYYCLSGGPCMQKLNLKVFLNMSRVPYAAAKHMNMIISSLRLYSSIVAVSS